MSAPNFLSMSDQISLSSDRRQRIRASSLWAAYGDALGFIAELTDRNGLRRRANVERVTTLVPWRRRVGGRFGPTVDLPAGTVSDDTQLRLATSRSIRPTGVFDVETFSEIELTTWPAYALGAGRGSLAAAANLRKRDTSWATNFFDAKGANYLQGGGNGAAMRVQPHVWGASPDAPFYSWLPDVIVNAVCTHGHERGFVGAAFHAGCVASALAVRAVPGPDEWARIIEDLGRLPEVIRRDDRLAEIWVGQWEKRSNRSLDDAVGSALSELAEGVGALSAEASVAGRAAYIGGVEALKAFEPSQRGSGTKTALLAAFIAWLFGDRPEDGLITCADYVGTDTDSIATMAGAILGAAGATPERAPGAIQDEAYIAREADRTWAAGAGLRPPSFPYPDVLGWRAPRSGTDAVSADKGVLHVAGLGPAGVVGKPYRTEGNSPGVWQWLELWFGQTMLAKRRERPPKLPTSQRVEASSKYVEAELTLPVHSPPQPDRGPRRPNVGSGDRRDSQRPGLSAGPLLQAREPRTTARSLDEITDDVIRAGLTDEAIGAGLREAATQHRSVEAGQGFAAIIVKALATRERQQRGSQPT